MKLGMKLKKVRLIVRPPTVQRETTFTLTAGQKMIVSGGAVETVQGSGQGGDERGGDEGTPEMGMEVTQQGAQPSYKSSV